MELHIDKLLIFDVQGPAAHFRKFYTNSSSLSYTFPPRTTITGLIAGILGRPRDSYYEELSSKQCKIAISIRTHLRKIMQTVNYVRTKSFGELNLSAGHTQVPLEIVLPSKNFEKLKYRIYFYHSGKTLFKLKEALESGRFFYPPCLGISEFIAEVKFIDFIKEKQISMFLDSTTPVEVVTAVNVEQIIKGGLIFELNSGKALQYVKERMPLEFDSDRKLKKAASFIYEKNQDEIKLKIKNHYYKIEYKDSKGETLRENILFMES
ncbi:type I-B CRISPR-associated protein Cas5 [Candidatus Aerophobetes bacterium]|nr:type I-B CRISPR-associated protein Cas5 [Candidatus Aerophobetes bacterium]